MESDFSFCRQPVNWHCKGDEFFHTRLREGFFFCKEKYYGDTCEIETGI